MDKPMKTLKLASALALLALGITGCFSVMRLPVPSTRYGYVDNVTGKVVITNTVWTTVPNYPMCRYPTLHLRGHLFHKAVESEAPTWQRINGPICGVISVIGLPGDFLVDTLMLYPDWNVAEEAVCPLCVGSPTWDIKKKD